MLATAVLTVHLMLAIALVAVVLLQRSEGGGLGIGGGSGSGLFTGRGTANLLTRTTAILAACFFGTSIILTLLAQRVTTGPSIFDRASVPAAPANAPVPAVAPSTAPAAGATAGAPAPAADAAKPSAPAGGVLGKLQAGDNSSPIERK